jgi:protein ImuB
MKRVLCVWLPNWPGQRSKVAGAKGARERELTDREALLRLVPWCEQFSPTVGLEASPAPECLLLDVTGLARLFGGEAALVEHVAREFRRGGLTVRLALADTLGAAWAVAHYGIAEFADVAEVARIQGARILGTGPAMTSRILASSATPTSAAILPPGHGLAALASLPVEALRLTPETVAMLRELGLTQIGPLTSLERAALATRFGAELLLRLDQAAGEVAELFQFHHPPPEAQAAWTFESPTDRHDLIDWALARLVERVVAQLAQRRGVQQLECRLRGQTTARAQFSIGLFRPSATPRHLEELIKLRLERQTLTEPVAGLELLVTATAVLEERQQELFAGAGPTAQACRKDTGVGDSRALALLIDRLSNRLGRAAVVRARRLPDAQPEFAWRYEAVITSAERGARNAERKNKRRASRSIEIAPRSALRAPSLALSRPLRLFPQPFPLDVVSVVPDGPPLVFTWGGRERRIERTWGPERIQTGWWRARGVGRDYYRVETSLGHWFWLFRQLADGRWFLHGVFE